MSRANQGSRMDAQNSLRRASGYRTLDNTAGSSRNPQSAPPLPTPNGYAITQQRPRNTSENVSNGQRRPTQAPKPAKVTLNAPAAGMDRRKSRVDGMLLKKRQSISYAQAEAQGFRSANLNAPPVPSMPANLSQGGQGRQPIEPEEGGLLITQGRQGPGGLDLEELNSEMFQVEDYLTNYLRSHPSKSNIENLKILRTALKSSADLMGQDLQQSVLANYANFVTIAKDLSALETEMLELKGTLEEWRAVPDSLELAADPADLTISNSLTVSTNRRAARSSIADLAAVYRNQLEALWENVEGCQTLLPPVPGRRVIAESAAFIELNSATYKPRGPVHLFLLNDSMLVAVNRKRQMGSKVRMVADKCFALNEIVVVDLKDGGELANAIKIKKSKEIFIFCADRPEDKKALLAAFKKVAEEMLAKKRKQSIWEAESRRDNDGTMSHPGNDTPNSFDPISHFHLSKLSTTKDASWIDDVSDDLSVLIATREFDRAVELAQRGFEALPLLKNDAALLSTYRSKMDSRFSDLTGALLRDIQSHSLNKGLALKLASWLQRLEATDRARETFLEGRASLVKKRVKQIRFEGDIESYIGELAIVVFTLVKNTCEWYMAAFRDSKLASGFVQWATQQVKLFSAMFERQMQGSDHDQTMVENALAITRAHAMVLRDVGLDFGFMFDQLHSDLRGAGVVAGLHQAL